MYSRFLHSVSSRTSATLHSVFLFLYSLFFSVSVLFFSASARARNISIENGLPSNTVRALAQDDKGFVWMGTDAGLCRYDGYGVKIFKNPLLPDQYVSSLLPVEQGLLIGTSNGVFVFNDLTESFAPLSAEIKGNVNSLAVDANGNIWIASAGSGVSCIMKSSKKCLSFSVKSFKGNVTSVIVDSNNQIWALTRQSGIFRYNKARDIFERMKTDNGITSFDGMCMAEWQGHGILVGTWDQGLLLYEANGTRQLINPLLTGYGSHIHTVYPMASGRVLVGCDEGLLDYNLLDGTSSLANDTYYVPGALGRFVYSILRDNEGGFWAGSFYGGVNYYSPMGKRFTTLTGGADGLVGNVVGRFCEDNRHRIWIATDDGGLNCYDLAAKRLIDFPGKKVLADLNIHALWSEGDLVWVGTYGNGLKLLNTSSGSVKTYLFSDASNSTSCYSLFRDSNGRLWAGSMDGAYRYDNKSDRFVKVKEFHGLVIDIDEDKTGNIWFATEGAGLWKLNKNGRWKNFRSSKSKNSLPDDVVNAVGTDVNGSIYVATNSGLCQYIPRRDNFKRINIDCNSEEFAGMVVCQDDVWLTSPAGLVHYVPGGSTHVFNHYDGLLSGPFQPNAAMMASDGSIWLGSVHGVSMFYPYQIKVNQSAPPVFITDFEIYNEDVKVGTERLPESLSSIDHISLSHKDNMFSIHFAALSYVSPEKNQYAYMLEGFDKNWIYSGSEHKATYTNIPPGTYTFRVKATNNDGTWSNKEAKLKIVVHPPFYWSLPAKIFYILLFIALIYLYVQMRLRRAERKHQRELKAINEQREKDARKAQLRFFTMIAHEIRTPVSLIIGPLENLKDQWKKISNSIANTDSTSSTLDIIDRNAHRLLDLVNQLLDFNKVQQKGLKVRFKLCNIREIMDAVAERFQPTLEQKGVDFKVEYPSDDFAAVIDPEGVTKIISNLMTNATKYTKSMVRLSCIEGKDSFTIEVEDDGVGISDDEQNRIFSPFFQASNNKPGTGIGLSIVTSLVNAHHGKVSVKSQLGKGSLFTVTLPVNQQDAHIGDEDVQKKVIVENVSQPSVEAGNEDATVVLIVEDDDDMRQYLKNNFQQNCQVITADDGLQGLRQLNDSDVSLIVSDWMMPNMDGEELCRKVRLNPRTSHIPFIMLTAKTDDDSKVKGMEIGADAYIEKPFSMKYLEACIRNLIKRRRELMEEYAQTPSEPISSLTENKSDSTLLADMEKIIEENIDNPELNVKFIADELNISRSGLFAKIKALADVTPNEMIQVVRLRHAARLLNEGKYSVSEISFMVGFNSASYFSKCFQKQFGVRPAEYGKSNGH